MTLLPSWPASGESLAEKVIASVGGSIGCAAQRGLDLEIAQGVGHGRAIEAGERHDVAGLRLLQPDPLEAAERQDLGDAGLLDRRAVARRAP